MQYILAMLCSLGGIILAVVGLKRLIKDQAVTA